MKMILRRNFHQSARFYKFVRYNLADLEVSENKNKESIISEVLSDKTVLSDKEWSQTRDKILSSESNQRLFNDVNIDSMLIGFCTGQKKYELACSYVSYLEKQKKKLNLGTVGKYLKLMHQMSEEKVRPLDEEYVLSLYKQLQADYKVLDTITSEIVIEVLSSTKYWKECLKLLDEIKLLNPPSSLAFSYCAAAAFRNKEDDLAWSLVNDTLKNNRVLLNDVYFQFLSRFSCTQKNSSKDLETLFNFLRSNDIKIDEAVASKLVQVAGNCNFNCCFTTIQNRGVCENCNKKLQKLLVSQSEFEDLKRDFFNNVVVGKNVFCKTSPAEVEKFKQFIAKLGKIDVVIDGLNVAYSIGVKQPVQVLSTLVAAVVRYFVERNQSVLVLGRVHMNRWPKNNWSYVTNNAKVFLTENLSSDDPYALYCALSSGLNTTIVSRDLMRGHKYLLNTPQHRSVFGRWYAQNQYQLLYVNKERKPVFKFPLPYMVTAQEQNGIWHIPYERKEESNSYSTHWLCLTKIKLVN